MNLKLYTKNIMTVFSRKNIMKLKYALLSVAMLMNIIGMTAFAEVDTSASGPIFGSIFRAVTIITTTIGAIFLIVGIVKFVIAHANEDGPNQQKAAMMIATGIALAIIGPLMNTFGIEGIIQTDN